MSNEGFSPLSSPLSLPLSLSLLSPCHICGLCGDVSPLRMDSPAQKRPYYIYILLHHEESHASWAAELCPERGRECEGGEEIKWERERGEGMEDGER